MTSVTLRVNGARAHATVSGPLTSGMVGIPVTIEYDDEWTGLTKNLVCRCGKWGFDRGESRTILNVGETATVAHEVMQADTYLYLGIEGYSANGDLVMPTTWAECGKIQKGANSEADPSADPNLPVWAQLQREIHQIRQQAVTNEGIEAVVAAYLDQNLCVPNATWTAEQINALDGMFKLASYKNDPTAAYAAFKAAFSLADSGGTEVTLTGISVVYNGGQVAVGTAVDNLTGIVVTAYYSDGSARTVTGYTLSGEIAEGKNTVTVTYGGQAATVNVTGAADAPEIVTYTVNSGLINVESTNASAVINEGASYTATLTPAAGYELDRVTVTMGGVDVTADVYADGVITIPCVTGNVVVTAIAAEIPAGENNGWTGGEAYAIEWTDGYHLDSTGAEIESTSMSVSNFLPCQNVSRMVTSNLYSNYQLWYYDADKNFLRRAPFAYVVNQTNIETYRDAHYVRTYKRLATTNASVVPYYDDLLDANTTWEAGKYYRLNWNKDNTSELALCYGASVLQFSNASRSFVHWYDADKNKIDETIRQNTTTAVTVPEGAFYFSIFNAIQGVNFWVQLS